MNVESKKGNIAKNETWTKDAEKMWEKLTLSNNFIFCKVMMNKELCRKILSEILGEEVSRVEYPEYEKVIQSRYDAKSVRLDVYLRDDEETVYNVEMQNTLKDCIPKRGRYYQDLIDIDLLEKGSYYEELNKSIVIFICTFDLYKMGYYKYTFTNKCSEVPELEYGDETTKIIVNTKGGKGEASDELKDFLNAVDGRFSKSEFSDKIRKEVEKVKHSRDARREFMYLYVHDEDVRRESLEKGKEEGKIEGRIEMKKYDIFELLEELGMIPEQLRKRVDEQSDIEVLKQWHKLSAKVSTIEEFEEKIKG